MKQLMIYMTALLFSSGAWAAGPVSVCKSVDEVFATAKDEPCDVLVEEARECFRILNKEQSDFMESANKKSSAQVIKEGDSLVGKYSAAVETLKTYAAEMSQGACGDQKASIETWMDEFNQDKDALTKRVNKAKQPARKR